jgi:hypothetical protein
MALDSWPNAEIELCQKKKKRCKRERVNKKEGGRTKAG